MSLLEAWSRIDTLSFEGESVRTETDKATGETVSSPEPSRFKCWMSDLQLNRARWKCDETGRSWECVHFIDPIRYRVEFSPRVCRWRNGSAPFLVMSEIQACDGKDVVSEERSRSRRTRYILDDYREGKWLHLFDLGLRCLPPFLSISPNLVIGEIDAQSLAPQAGQNTHTPQYTVKFPDYLLTVDVTWDATRHWFTKIESTRLGMPSVLLEKLRRKENLSREEETRLRTEREVIETESFLADDFEESPQAGIYFPRKLSFSNDWRDKRLETWTWTFKKWMANVPVPNELFRLEIPAGCHVHDRRKTSS